MKKLPKIAVFFLIFVFLVNFTFAKEKIDINTASVKELQKIIGIGEILAQRIIKNRPFYSLDDLLKVEGIGSKTLEKIKKQGLAWVDPDLKPPPIKKEDNSFENKKVIMSQSFDFFNEQILRFFSLFLIALAIAVFSSIIILIFKKKLNKNW